MNLFMTYAFDRWMQEIHPYCPFARYADDAVAHCLTEKQAQYVLGAIERRLVKYGLKLNLQKSSIVYCRDSRRREAHACKQFTFLGYTFRPRVAKSRHGRIIQCFLPGVSPEAKKKMLRTIRSWKLTRQTPASIGELAARYNPILRGWWNYYGHFYKTALRRVFECFEATLARWADVSTRSSCGMKAAASAGYDVLHEGSQTCSPIGAHMVRPADGQWEPCESRGSRTVLPEAGGATPPAY
jgi:RNA-directed DNA polymerase